MGNALKTREAINISVNPNISSMTWTDLTSVPEKVFLNEKEYQLETSIWRDFMPICESSGRPMIAVLTIKTVDSSQFPSDVEADLAWFILGNNDQAQIWETHVVEEQPRVLDDTHTYLRVMARNGPKWEPHANVDVVVQLKNAKGQSVILQAKRQTIHRTD